MADSWRINGKVLVAGVEYDHSGQYMAVGPFECAWP
jgi:hypothetical protein